MEIRWHANIDTFLELSQADLEQNEALNNLMLGVCFRAKDDPNFSPDIKLATVTCAGGLRLAAVMTPPQNLILFAEEGYSVTAVNVLADSLIKQNIYIPGVVGEKGLVEMFSAIWTSRLSCTKELQTAMRVYGLKRVNSSVIGPGVFRAAEERDLHFVIPGRLRFIIEAGLEDNPDPDESATRAKESIKKGNIFVWEDQGKVVSMAAKARQMRGTAVIGLVYTPPQLRGRGYATSCAAALSQHLLASGYEQCALFTDLANPTSNSIYRRIGYEPVGDFDSCLFNYGRAENIGRALKGGLGD